MFASLVSSLLLFCATPSAAGSAESVVYTTEIVPGDPANLIATVGEMMNYFQDEGIELKYVPRQKARKENIPEELVSFGRLALDQETDASSGSYKAVAYAVQDAQHPTDAIVVPAGSTAKTLSDLRGMKTFYYRGAKNCVPVLRKLLAQNGFPEGTVAISTAGKGLNTVAWEAAFLREPDLSLSLKRGAARVLIEGPIFSSRIADPWPMAVYALTDSFIKNRPSTAAHVVAAIDRAIAFIHSSPDAARAIYWSKASGILNMPGLRPRVFDYERSDEIPAAVLQRESDWNLAQGLIRHKIDASIYAYRR